VTCPFVTRLLVTRLLVTRLLVTRPFVTRPFVTRLLVTRLRKPDSRTKHHYNMHVSMYLFWYKDKLYDCFWVKINLA
jgi:hypothetical protein